MGIDAEVTMIKPIAARPKVTRQWAKVRRFTIATQQQMQCAVYVQAIQRRFRTADVGRFRIVNPTYAVMLQHNFKAMRQTSECG
uniref:Uncharacterized protein n=1 Tax=Panagrolaimus superbus TaxID=310955 RepID=A0A914XXJ4_9BILA